MNHITTYTRWQSLRGLVPLRNRRGAPYSAGDLQRWLRLSRFAFKTAKLDLLASARDLQIVENLLEYALELHLRLSLRTECEEAPPPLDDLRERGLMDVLLAPADPCGPRVEAWLDACRDAELPVRFQWQGPWPPDLDARAHTARLTEAGVCAVTLCVADAFRPPARCKGGASARASLAAMNRLAAALREAGVEVNIAGLPRAWVDEGNRACMLEPGCEPGYRLDALHTARTFHGRPRNVTRIALVIEDIDAPSRLNKVDNLVLQYLLHKREFLLRRLLFLHKLTRFSKWFRSMPEDLAEIAGAGAARAEAKHAAAALRAAFPGLTHDADCTPDAAPRTRYLDVVDTERAARIEQCAALAREANQTVTNRPHDFEAGPDVCRGENGHAEPMPGSLRWYSAAAVEKRGTPLGRFAPPVTISAVFGGGHAEYIGFALGRHIRLACPMDAPQHRLVLHVAGDGRYVLLRDGTPVEPVEFTGAHYVPLRLPGVLEPRLALWNIDGSIVTQTPLVWRGSRESAETRSPAVFSFVIVNVRYARRLQACLLAIAGQRGVAPERIEVLVAYIPGLDATDDLLDGVESAFPALRIVRAPFTARDQRAKGYLINETVRLASGEWVILLDADAVIPPDFLTRLDAAGHGADFVAPDGRKMLDRAATARILLGLCDPASAWDELAAGPGEWRRRESGGAAVGYCQCVRRYCFDVVRYPEFRHFEGADYTFALEMERCFGPVRRLEGLPILHLDHGFSQWYGTQKHF